MTSTEYALLMRDRETLAAPEPKPITPSTPRPSTASKALEHDEQRELIRWAQGPAREQYPELGLLHAIPNGGYRSKKTANEMKAEGQVPGIPDLCLPVARGGYHGLYIEMKRAFRHQQPKQGLSEPQREMLARLRAQGYRAEVCGGALHALDVIREYLRQPPTEIIKPAE